MIIDSNINEIKIKNRLLNTEKSSANSMRKISTGLKINSANDDPSGSNISSKLKQQIRGLARAQLNVQEGTHLSEIMSDSLDAISDTSLMRLKELSIEGASDTSGANDKKAMQNEVNQILTNIDSIATGTEYNGKKLLSPPLNDIQLQVGANYGDTYKIKLFDAGVNSIGLDGIDISTRKGAADALDKIDSAIDTVASYVAKTGSYGENLKSFNVGLGLYEQNLTSSNSQIEDSDVAKESLELAQSNIVTQFTLSIFSQANQMPESVIQLLK